MSEFPTVWIVDDDPDDQLFLEIAFKQLIPPVKIRKLNDGNELLPCLEEVNVLPKLILLDLNMTYKNGFETLADLRASPSYKDLPVVVLTTSSALEDKHRSLLLGADGYLIKSPIYHKTVDMLKDLVTEWQLN